jgi:cell wall assembly regulator SMI1
MDSIWERIKVWFERNVPSEEFSLADGATEAELSSAEAKLGLKLPSDVRESYLLHNGSNDCAVFVNHVLLPLEQIMNTWRMWNDLLRQGSFRGGDKPRELVGPIRPVWWNRRWIPFSQDGSGDSYCIDLDPLQQGHLGQVIDHSHEVGPVRVLAPSFSEFLSMFAADLETGKYRYDGCSVVSSEV